MNEQTLQKMKQMKFYGMAMAFRTSMENGNMSQLTSDEVISMLIDSEWDDRNNRKIERQVHNARFRYKANMEQLHFDIDRNLDKNQMMPIGWSWKENLCEKDRKMYLMKNLKTNKNL